MWGNAFAASITPVVFLSKENPPTRVAVAAPDEPPGARWGRPSTFTHSAANPPPRAGFEASFEDQEMEVNGVEHSRQWESIRVRNPDDESQYFDTEGVKSVTFYIGRRVVERMEDKSQGGPVKVLQPIIETVHEYLRFTFTLAGAEGSAGRRGEADPSPTPEPPETENGPAPIRFGVEGEWKISEVDGTWRLR